MTATAVIEAFERAPSIVVPLVDRQRLVAHLEQLEPEHWKRTAEHGEYSHYSVFILFRHLVSCMCIGLRNCC
jgi:hypothetical protein